MVEFPENPPASGRRRRRPSSAILRAPFHEDRMPRSVRPEPSQLADGLLLLVDGAYAASQVLGGPNGPAAGARFGGGCARCR